MAKLQITVGDKTIEQELSRPTWTAGRNPGLDLTLPVREASREHFRIGRLKSGGWAIKDLGSTNGTVLNGEAIATERLKHNDVIEIGKDCRILFLDPPPPPPPPPEPKKPKGPIVLKSRAERIKEEKDAELLKRRALRKAQRAAEAPPPPEPVAEEDEQTQTVSIDTIEIDSEATLDKMMKDKDGFDKVLQGGTPVVFGPYRIRKRIAEGGMGVVFKAQHRAKKFHVALKLLRTEKVDAENIARFKQEAWAISAFDHPNIVKVRDLSSHAGMYYIAMDFIDGSDLLKVGFERGLTFWEIHEAIYKLADVLRLVHARNIWHRDIKPQNVLLDRKGEVRLIDFGIATVEREQDDATKTADGLIMGTPAFLSPEQAARGKLGTVDGRADLYSLGAVMYYLLTGRRPFTGKTAIEILTNNMKKTPPHPCRVDPMVPPGMGEICMRLLEKHPEDRYQSATELQDALRKWRKEKDGRIESERHKKILKLRAMKAKKQRAR